MPIIPHKNLLTKDINKNILTNDMQTQEDGNALGPHISLATILSPPFVSRAPKYNCLVLSQKT